MIRRIIDFTSILIFLWASMILGLWIIDSIIVPLSLPSGPVGSLLTNIAKPAISFAMVFLWLWIWKKIVEKRFWSALERK